MKNFEFTRLKAKALQKTLEIVNDPRVMKIMQNPKVMNLVTKGFDLKNKIDKTIAIWKEK
ncbi:MAG: hypothetical protein PF689_12780 [Deltaproteobacteria bacterium]|jgi:hypothetical protein|nr:hypothetical protein [Deltaproteobacteria bacterium]